MTADDGLRCIVVDDHPMVRRAVRLQLGTLPWLHVVAEAADGQEGLDLLMELQPDIAVVDVRMPRMDGIELVRRARAADLHTRLVVFSAFASPALVATARAAGAAACVSKSGPPSRLLDVVTQLAFPDIHASGATTSNVTGAS